MKKSVKYPILKAPPAVLLGHDCDVAAHTKRLAATRKLRNRVAKPLRPLFDHALKLSLDSARRGYCQRAGTEHRHARKLVSKK